MVVMLMGMSGGDVDDTQGHTGLYTRYCFVCIACKGLALAPATRCTQCLEVADAHHFLTAGPSRREAALRTGVCWRVMGLRPNMF